jgi:NAD(P)-dependent dehydrogenase (short-subunit alcohol dehydrogenase family)
MPWPCARRPARPRRSVASARVGRPSPIPKTRVHLRWQWPIRYPARDHVGVVVAKLQPDQVRDSLHPYQLSKRANSLRVVTEAVRWGKRAARVNTIRPGIIIAPLAKGEISGREAKGTGA